MKRIPVYFSFAFILIPLLLGCKKVGYVQFNLDYQAAITIQSGAGISIPLSILTPDIESNSQSEFAINDTRKDKVENIRLTAMSLEITSPNGQEFDFVEDLELFISADGVDEIVLAYVYDMDNSVGNFINITCSQSDFQEYIKKDKFTLRVRTVTDEYNLSDVDISINCTFRVNAKLIGNA